MNFLLKAIYGICVETDCQYPTTIAKVLHKIQIIVEYSTDLKLEEVAVSSVDSCRGTL